jgi:glycosyltransferase involved in cell wall biosynthesis
LPKPPIPSVIENLHKARHIISVAKWIIDEFFPEHAAKTTVIPNGVCLADWDAVPEGESGIEPGYILVKGYHGWLEHLGIVVHATEALPGQRFVVIEKQTPLIAWPDNVIVIPIPIPEPRMQRIIKDCAAFISPSSEVNPVMAMEAMACRKPVFGLDFHGNREVIPPQLRYHDADGLIWLVRNTFALQETAAYWGHFGRDRVEALYNWERLANDILAVYEDAAR